MEFISVVHRDCIGLLRLSAMTLLGYSSVPWRVYVQDDSVAEVRGALSEFDNICVIDQHPFGHQPGWIAQQLIKLWSAGSSSQEWVAVIGPGNCLVGQDPFFAPNGQPWIELRPNHDPKFRYWWESTQAYRGIQTSAPSVLTPWIWHTPTLKQALDTEPRIEDWTTLPCSTEQFFYYSWAYSRVDYQVRTLTKGLVQPMEDPSPWIRWARSNPAPWWVLHRSAWNQQDHVAVTLAVLGEAGALNPDQTREFWEDYTGGRWSF